MNCHGSKKGKKRNNDHSPIRHMLHMVLCCGLPIIIVALLPVISKISPGMANIVSGIVPFLCPLMMLVMIPMMFGGNKKSSCCGNKRDNHEISKLDNPID